MDSSAQSLYNMLIDLKKPDSSGKTSQQRLIQYCLEVLGGIERVHIDFKEKYNRRNPNLEDDDKKNLAKALSGFANSSGGVLIWGVENNTIRPKPIYGIQKFVQNMLELSSNLTDPKITGVDVNWLEADNVINNEGFGVIYIPESQLPPHRVILNQSEVKNNYYVRSGESFVVANHTQLEDMFGRRPKPVLSLSKRLLPRRLNAEGKYVGETSVFLGIKNTGRGSARAPLLCLDVVKPYNIRTSGIDGNMHYGLPKLVTALDVREWRFGSSTDVIHSGTSLEVAKVIVHFSKDMNDGKDKIPDLIISYKIAADGTQLIEGQDITTGVELFSELEKTSS